MYDFSPGRINSWSLRRFALKISISSSLPRVVSTAKDSVRLCMVTRMLIGCWYKAITMKRAPLSLISLRRHSIHLGMITYDGHRRVTMAVSEDGKVMATSEFRNCNYGGGRSLAMTSLSHRHLRDAVLC